MSDWTGKTVFITGATGFLGGTMARELTSRGVYVKALARRPGRDKYLQGISGIEMVAGDLSDSSHLTELMQGCEIVFHVAAQLGGTYAVQYPANVIGTRNMAQAAAQAGIKRFVHVSSVAVYGPRIPDVVTEDTPLNPGVNPYNITKAEAESVLKEVAQQKDLAYTIIRPGMIYGPRNGMWTAGLFRLASRRPLFFAGDGRGSAYTIYVDDVVDLALTAALHPAAVNEAFNAVNDPAPTWRDFIGGYAKLAKNDSWVSLPIPLLQPVAYLIEAFLRLRGEPQALPSLMNDFLVPRKRISMDKGRRLLSWQPRIALAEGIARCEPYLREKGLLR
jgi:nucleoside-diphosphate-sugar epimerase